MSKNRFDNPKKWVRRVRPGQILKHFFQTISKVILFTVFLTLFSFDSLFQSLRRWRFTKFIFKSPPFELLYKIFTKIINRLDRPNTDNVSKHYLIELAWHNLTVKRTRSFVTIGGIAIGFAAIVFLVSIGYGVQKVVIDQVADLKELKQAEVYPGLVDDLALTDESLAKFRSILHVEDVQPLITVVGRVDYQDSVFDMAVYGVTNDYLVNSATQTSTGEFFKNNELVKKVVEPKKTTDTGVDAETSFSDTSGSSTINEESGTLPFVELEGESTPSSVVTTEKVEVQKGSESTVIVNTSTLRALNMTESEAIGKEIKLTFVVTGELADKKDERLESTPTTYTIGGVIADDTTPYAYVPFIDLKSLGINKYTHIKVTVDDQSNLETVRGGLESKGYGTTSAVDTIDQIESFFSVARILLAVIGTIALSVASLGMFNTLTVSLLERTREVGLMKAMGMKSDEVNELFLTESMIMGFMGGVLGLILGYVAGKLLSVLLSTFFLAKGHGIIDVTDIPPLFMVTILLLSVAIGFMTGIYPARRATRISALNALRYE